MMRKNKNISVGLPLCEFENRVPDTAKMKRVRLDADGRVVFALGYDKDETVAVMWTGEGKAFVRIISSHVRSLCVELRSYYTKRFNGYLYHRYPKFDLKKDEHEAAEI